MTRNSSESRKRSGRYLESFLQPTMGKPMPDKQWNSPNRPPAEKKGGRHGVPLDCFGPGQNQGQGQYQMGVMPGSPQVAQMMPMPVSPHVTENARACSFQFERTEGPH